MSHGNTEDTATRGSRRSELRPAMLVFPRTRSRCGRAGSVRVGASPKWGIVNSKQAARPGLGCHISDFQISPTSDLGPVPAGMGHPPEGPVTLEEPLPLTLDDWKQHGDLRRPDTLTGVVARIPVESRPSGVPRQPFGESQVRAGELGDKRAPAARCVPVGVQSACRAAPREPERPAGLRSLAIGVGATVCPPHMLPRTAASIAMHSRGMFGNSAKSPSVVRPRGRCCSPTSCVDP